jgi:hypothetical protein
LNGRVCVTSLARNWRCRAGIVRFAEDWLGKWAMNLMLINVSTRKFRRAVRLPDGDVPAPAGAGVSKSAASRHFVALSAARMKEWMGADLSRLDIMVVQIDGIHISEHLVLVAALGIDSQGFKEGGIGIGPHIGVQRSDDLHKFVGLKPKRCRIVKVRKARANFWVVIKCEVQAFGAEDVSSLKMQPH